MALISDATLGAIRRRLEAVEVAKSSGLELKRDGPKRLVGRCPFHRGAEATFVVTESGFDCAGCDARGDAIALYAKLSGQDPETAVRALARRLGVPVAVDTSAPASASRIRDRSEILSDLQKLDAEPDLAKVSELVRGLALSLVGLDGLEKQVTREAAIRALRGKIAAPTALIDAALQCEPPAETSNRALQGGAVLLRDPEPSPDPVDGTELLAQLARVVARYVALPAEAVIAVALWLVHTYSLDAAFISPILALVSPVKRCGKTTLLTVLSLIARRPLSASNVTPAALFRAVEGFCQTLLIDEADTFLRRSDELRGIINSGHTRSTAFVVRIVGDTHEPRTFSTWAPKAIASIGRLASTIEDRSIVIEMRRKAPGEKVERLRLDRVEDFEAVRSQVARWAGDHALELRAADPEVPVGLHDRAADNWRPLLAIADTVGGDWPEKARAAATSLSAGFVEDDDGAVAVQLLADLRTIFVASRASFFTEEILAALCEREDRPWAEWRQDQPLSAVQLARLLKPFSIRPRQIRIGTESKKGYEASSFEDAFLRYLPVDPKQRNNPDELRVSPESAPETSRDTVSDPTPSQIIENK